MFRLSASIGMTIGAAVLAVGFIVLPANHALASGRSCQTFRSFQTCDNVNGSGLHVNYVQGSLYNGFSDTQPNVHIQISGPKGTLRNCAATSINPLQTIYCTWSPNSNEPTGNYCTTSWQYVSGSYVDIGHACVDVHS
jgi:hypothetical protein